MNKVFLALIALLLASPAAAQQPGGGNNDTSFSTPGNGFVQGVMQMCKSTTGTAVPCNTAAANGAGAAGFPAGATPVTNSATGTTAAVTATLPAAAAKFTYICGFTATGNEAATGAVVAVTATGTVSGTLNFNIGHVVTPALGVLTETFTPCVPSSAVNTAIAVTSAADAAGTNVAVTAWGYQL